MAEILSQDEIDSLLSIIGDDDEEDSGNNNVETTSVSNTNVSTSLSLGPINFDIKDKKFEKIEYLLDIKVPISIEVDRVRFTLKKLMELYPGAIITLTKEASAPLDVLANGKLIAKGEVVIVDEKFGVRIVDLVSPEERIKSLR